MTRDTNNLQYVASICNDYSDLNTRIKALSSLDNRKYHNWEKVLLMMEHIQLLSQTLLLFPSLYEDPSLNHNLLYAGVIYCAKIMNPGFWLIFEGYEHLTLALLISFMLSIIFKYTLFLYMIVLVYKNLTGWRPLITVWQMIFKAQGRVLCYSSTCFWAQIISRASRDNYTIMGISTAGLIVWATWMFIFEYIFSFILEIRYFYVLPTKSFLASKDNRLDILTLTQKLIIQIFRMSLPLNSTAAKWVITSTNMLLSVLKETHYFTNLSLYNIQALFYQGTMMIIVLSLHLSCFTETILDSLEYKSNMAFIITVWIILTIIARKAFQEYLGKVLSNYIGAEKQESSKLMIQKIIIIKYLRKFEQMSSETAEKYQLSFLYNSSASAKIKDILNLEKDLKTSDALDKNSTQSENNLFVQYLESLNRKFPKDEYLRLYMAYFYAKKLERFGIAIKIINDLRKSSSYNIALGASLLVYELQDAIKKTSLSNKTIIDLPLYLKSISLVAQLEAGMMEQLEAQKNLYTEIINDSTNLQYLLKYGEAIFKQKQQIEKQVKRVFENIPSTYTRPLMVCSLYYLSLNDTVRDYSTYYKRYCRMSAKYEKCFRSEKINNENIYQDNCVFLVFTGQKPEAGKIVYCSKTIKDMTGRDPEYYVGKSAAVIPPLSVRNFYDRFFQNLAEKADKSLLGKTIRGLGLHKEGYLTAVEFYVDVSPFMTQGFYLDMIVRPLPSPKEFILILENGDIEGGTKNIARRLGIQRPETHDPIPFVNIETISLELKEVNKAFNLINAFHKSTTSKEVYRTMKDNFHAVKVQERPNPNYLMPENHLDMKESQQTEMSLEKAKELFEVYSTTGKIIELSSLMPENYDEDWKSNNYTYHCTFESRFYGQSHFKVLTLEEVEDPIREDEEQMPRISRRRSESWQVGNENKIEKYDDHNEEIENDSADFDFEDEKKTGWIEFKTHENPPLTQTIPFETIEEPLNSPLTDNDMIPTPKAPLIPITDRHQEIDSKSTKTLVEDVQRVDETKIFDGSITSQKSKNAQHEKISTAFRIALSVKYSPRIFKTMPLLFYGLLIVVFIIQLEMKTRLDQALINLQLGKDIVAAAEERSFILANGMLMARLIWDIGTQRINTTGLGAFNYPASLYASFIKTDSLNLAKINQGLLSNVSKLDDEARETFFTQDIRMFDTPEDRSINRYSSFNNFQAIERIITTSLKAVSIIDTKPVIDAQEQLFFLLDNTVNDIYVKNEVISDNLNVYFGREQKNIDDTVTIILATTTGIFILVTIVLSIAVVREYYSEKANLLAVAKLNTQGVIKALGQINRFKRTLESEIRIAERHCSLVMGGKRREGRDLSFKKRDKKESLKNPNHNGILMKYILYIGKLWGLIVLLIGLSLGSCLSARNSIRFFQIKESQLYFTQRLKSHVTLVGVVTQELFAGNGETLNHNEPTSQLIGKSIEYLTTLKNRVSTTYMKEDFTYDPRISDILFVDGCPAIEDPTWKYFCSRMTGTGKKTGLVYILGDIENLAEAKKLRFDALDGATMDVLAKAQVEDFENIVVDYFAIANQCAAIAKILDGDFEDAFMTSNNQRNDIFLIFSIILALLALLIWIFVFSQLRNLPTQFRKVLQAFPAALILASFPLKNLLMKTSKGALDVVKNDI